MSVMPTRRLSSASCCDQIVLAVLLLLLSVVPGGRVSVIDGDGVRACGERELGRRSRDCTRAFVSQLYAVQLAKHKFFTGVDVESIRSVCSWFQTSVDCLQSVSDQCSSSALVDDVIDSLLRPHLTLFQLCTRRNLYEDYAMYQRCFRRLHTRSNACYADFRSRADDVVNTISLPSNAVSDYQRQMALHTYCRELDGLTSCVETGVRNRCSRPASKLVDVLVRSSVQLSPLCTDDVTSRTPAAAPPPTLEYGRTTPGGAAVSTTGGDVWRTLLVTSLSAAISAAYLITIVRF